MRLSLKTVLAYMDRLFDAEYQSAIEGRIVGEELSVRFIERIKSIINNADLSVPGRCGEKEEWSSNLVAAYLDHRLSETEQLQYENICVRSDVFLAETACVHQILTHVLGQPAQMNRECRLRLYAIPKRQKISSASAATQEPSNVGHHTAQDENAQTTADHRQETIPFPTACPVMPAPEECDKAETETKNGRKRRIVVMSQGQEISNAVSNATSESPEVREHGDIRFMADAVKNGEVPSERLDFYTTEDRPRPDAVTPVSVPPVDKNRRLGQAFEQMKRRKRMVTALSLVLVLIFISFGMLFGSKKPRQEGPNQNQITSKKSQPLPDDPKNNDERFADNHYLWAKPDASSDSHAASRAVSRGGDARRDVSVSTVATHNSIYVVNESPESVMHYMPGDPRHQQSADANANASNFQAMAPQNESSHIAAQPFAAQPSQRFGSEPLSPNMAGMTQAMPSLETMASTGPTGHEIERMAMANAGTDFRGMSSFPGGGDAERKMMPYQTSPPGNGSQTAFSTASATSARFASGNVDTHANFGGLSHTVTQEEKTSVEMGSLQRPAPELTMQLIDRGSAQSVDQFLDNTLPAVQPAGMGIEKETNRVSPSMDMTRMDRDIRAAFTEEPRQADFNMLSNAVLLPQYQSIEQASYVAVPEAPYPLLPPLVEPAWNETNSGDFESLPALPQLKNITNNLPIPESPESLQLFEVAHQNEPMRATAPVPSVATGATEERRLETAGNLIEEAPLRLPEKIARSNRVTSVSPQENRRNIPVEPNGHGSAMLILGTEDLALVRDNPESDWSWLPVSQTLKNDIVLVPAPFQAVIRFANGIVVETEGDTRIRILSDDPEGRPGIAFDCGHLTVSAAPNGFSKDRPEKSPVLRIVTPVGGGVLRLADAKSFVRINSENKTMVKLLRVTRPYESVTYNPEFQAANERDNTLYCPNLMACPAKDRAVFWQKDGHDVEWELAATSIFPIDLEKGSAPIIVYDMNDLVVTPAVVWPSLVSHDGNIPISKLDLKNQFVTMPHTFYPTLSKTWLLK